MAFHPGSVPFEAGLPEMAIDLHMLMASPQASHTARASPQHPESAAGDPRLIMSG